MFKQWKQTLALLAVATAFGLVCATPAALAGGRKPKPPEPPPTPPEAKVQYEIQFLGTLPGYAVQQGHGRERPWDSCGDLLRRHGGDRVPRRAGVR